MHSPTTTAHDVIPPGSHVCYIHDDGQCRLVAYFTRMGLTPAGELLAKARRRGWP